MIATWVLAAVLAEAADTNQIVVAVPGAAMTCTREADHLVCVVPLDKEVVGEPQQTVDPVFKSPQPYRRTAPTPSLPNPEALSQLKVAKANIELAKSLLPKATTPEETVLAQQLLYWANEQYRTSEALLQTVDLHNAPDPFDRRQAMTVCQADVTESCEAMP